MSIGLIRAALFSLALAGCAQSQAQPEPVIVRRADVEEGRRLAEVYCATCHAIGEEGVSRHGQAPPFRMLSRSYPVNTLEEAFAEGILVGHRDMPQFEFTPDQIEDIVSYLQTIQDQRAG